MAGGKISRKNIVIKDLPISADRIIGAIARMRGLRKWEIVLEALVEYAENHKLEISKFTEDK